MDRTLSRIASLVSLKITNVVLGIYLAGIELFFVLYGYRNFSPVYIILLVIVTPWLLSAFLKGSNGKMNKASAEIDSLPFPELRKKHKYSPASFYTYSYGFMIILAAMLIWHFKTTAASLPDFDFALQVPVLSIGIYAATRLVTWLFYFIMFKFFPTIGWKL